MDCNEVSLLLACYKTDSIFAYVLSSYKSKMAYSEATVIHKKGWNAVFCEIWWR